MKYLQQALFATIIWTSVFTSPWALADDEAAIPHISGPISDRFLNYMRQLPPNSTVVVSSLGGSAAVGIDIAEFVQANHIHIQVDEFCLSACAEYILPAAESVELGPHAIIGFHGGDFLFENLAQEAGADDSCAAPRTAALHAIYAARGLNPSFANEVAARLEITSYRPPSSPTTCDAAFDSRRLIWFPSGDQLRSLWGLHFTGSICVDDTACVEERMKHMIRSGREVMFGDEPYVYP
jgi:hypothetical protein